MSFAPPIISDFASSDLSNATYLDGSPFIVNIGGGLSGLNYPEGGGTLAANGLLYFPGGNKLADSTRQIFGNNGTAVVDASSQLLYANGALLTNTVSSLMKSNGHLLADGGGTIYYDSGRSLATTDGRLWFGNNFTNLTDTNGSLCYNSGAILTDATTNVLNLPNGDMLADANGNLLNGGGAAGSTQGQAFGSGAYSYQRGMMAHASAQFVTGGDCQSSQMEFGAETTDATPTELLNLADASRYSPPSNGFQLKLVLIIAEKDDHTAFFTALFQVAFTNAGGTVAVVDSGKIGFAGVNMGVGGLGLTFGASGGSLTMTVVGNALANLRWNASIIGPELIY